MFKPLRSLGRSVGMSIVQFEHSFSRPKSACSGLHHRSFSLFYESEFSPHYHGIALTRLTQLSEQQLSSRLGQGGIILNTKGNIECPDFLLSFNCYHNDIAFTNLFPKCPFSLIRHQYNAIDYNRAKRVA
jgi:hypothetical protein